MAKSTKKTSGKTKSKTTKFSIVNNLHESILAIAEVTKSGQVKIKRTELKNTLEDTFKAAAAEAAKGQRVRFPVIGTLARRDVKGRKAGKGVNPFTGEEMMIKARPESKKPRWSFPKSIKETFANKKLW